MADGTKNGGGPPQKNQAHERKRELKRQHQRGLHADAVLRNPLVKEAFEKIEKFIDTTWKDSEAGDSKDREHLYFMHRALKDFRAHLESTLRNGELATNELEKVQQAEEARNNSKG